MLQEIVQKTKKVLSYSLKSGSGPDHLKFLRWWFFKQHVCATGKGRNKKEAERRRQAGSCLYGGNTV
jgi:dsRNA-specific ribonuclease